MEKRELLKKVFGYDSFREGQEAIIDHILEGRDVLAIMPTGAGKSICYQIPALLETGITVVISPLISLMIDQVKSLNQAGIHAAYINSTLSESQINKALELAKQGKYKIIYVAPERLENTTFMDFASNGNISILAIDEAHCISQWGQDFRPSYLKILQFIKQLQRRPVICAFTATATERVKEDIGCILNLENPFITYTGFDRPNLYFKVQPIQQKKAKDSIRAWKEEGEHLGIAGFLEQKEPLSITLSTITGLKCVKCMGNCIYVVENPIVFAQIIEAENISALCVNGQPNLAVLLLLDLIVKYKGVIYYSGDFDPEGLLIAQRLKNRYEEALRFWHYEKKDYEVAISDKQVSEKRLKMLEGLSSPELIQIGELLREHKKAGYQERIYKNVTNQERD